MFLKHRVLLAQVTAIIPKDAQVTFLGDGEFDGVDVHTIGWRYVCRTASNILVLVCGVQFHVGDLEPPRGALVALTPAWMMAKEYGPVSILALWEAQYMEPIYFVTNMHDLDEAAQQYKGVFAYPPQKVH